MCCCGSVLSARYVGVSFALPINLQDINTISLLICFPLFHTVRGHRTVRGPWPPTNYHLFLQLLMGKLIRADNARADVVKK